MVTKEQIMDVLKEIQDPELKMDLVTLGLIYEVTVDADDNVSIRMTFTSMMCPYGPQLVDTVKVAVGDIGAKTVEVEVTFDPPWKPSEEVLATLGL